jgi:arabinofuranosyltransferase
MTAVKNAATPGRVVARRATFRHASLAIAAWCAVFIARSSFRAFDHSRQFCLFDDAMIAMRYAWNLAHGQGLVWNPGERVEGYTSLLMALVMAVPCAALDRRWAVFAVQLMGVATLLAIAWLCWRIAAEWPGDVARRARLRWFAVIGAVAYYPLAYWTLLGMETGLVTLLLLAGVLALLRWERTRGAGWLFVLAGAGGLAAITRPDAVLLFVPLLLRALAPRAAHELPGAAGRAALAVALFATPPLLQELFRIGWYGDVVPNTYRLKLTGMPLGVRLANGAGFVAPFMVSIALPLAVVMVAAARRPGGATRVLATLPLVLIAYQVWVGGDPWSYWRMLTPAMPLLFLLFADAVLAWSAARVRGPAPVVAAGIMAVALLIANARFLPELLFLQRPFQWDANRRNVQTALALQRVTRDDATVGVFWAGAIPYFAGRRAIDFLGKSDRATAALPPDLSGAVAWSGMTSVPGHNKYDLDAAIRVRQPTYVQGFVWGRQDLTRWAQDHYVEARHRGIHLLLLRRSPAVRWERLEVP